jgi:hypothetical protein
MMLASRCFLAWFTLKALLDACFTLLGGLSDLLYGLLDACFTLLSCLTYSHAFA